jgi:hypothetical protein
MSSLSQASRLADLPSAHDAFQGHAAHRIEWSICLGPRTQRVPVYPQVFPHSSTLLHGAAHAPTTMPHPTPQEDIGISYGSRLPTSTCLGILPEVSRVHTVGLQRNDGGGVLLDAPSALCGSRDCLQGRTRLTCTVPIALTTCAMRNPTASIYD